MRWWLKSVALRLEDWLVSCLREWSGGLFAIMTEVR